MPIHINLLAEAHALEEIRRKDPVKRAAWAAFLAVCGVLLVSCILWAKIITYNSQLTNLAARLGSSTNQYTLILSNKQRLAEVNAKLGALNRFATNRFLQANLLDALQHATLEGLQIVQLRTEQAYEITPEVKPTTNPETGKTIPGKPGASVERNKLVLNVRDNSESAHISAFKDTLAHTTYFEMEKVSTNQIRLTSVAQVQYEGSSGKPFVQFDLECLYPDRRR